MKQENHINNEHKLNNLLGNIDKKSGFTTPDSYFESLLEDINHKKLKNNNLKFNFDILPYRILAPFLVLIVFFVSFLTFNQTPENNLSYNEVIYEEIIAFNDDILTEEYAEILPYSTSEIVENDEEVIDYLINNNININSILEEYEN